MLLLFNILMKYWLAVPSEFLKLKNWDYASAGTKLPSLSTYINKRVTTHEKPVFPN